MSCDAHPRGGVSSPDDPASPPGEATAEKPPREGAARDDVPWDPETMLRAEPWSLLARMDLADLPRTGPEARLAATVYRTSFDAHSFHPEERRWLLSLEAARWGAVDLLDALADVPAEEPPAWRPLWATGGLLDERLRLSWPESSHQGTTVHGVIPVEGRPAAVVTAWNRGWLRDLETGGRSGELLIPEGYSVLLNSTAITEADGRLLVVADGYEPTGKIPTVEVWDALTGEHFGTIPTGHAGMVKVVATAVVNGRAVVASAGWDGDLEVHDLLTGDEVCPPLPGADVNSLETAVLDGPPAAFAGTAALGGDRPVLGETIVPAASTSAAASTFASASASAAGTATPGDGFVVVTTGRPEKTRLWRLRAGHPPLPTDEPPVTVWSRVAEETPQGRMRLRDLHTGAPVGPALPFTWAGWGLVPTVLRGRRVAVTGAPDGRVRVWDLSAYDGYEPARELGFPSGEPDGSPEPPGHPLPGHAIEVRELTVVTDGDRTTVVSRDKDGGMLTWDAATGRAAGPVDPDAENRAVRVERIRDGWVTLRDPRTGREFGPPLGPFAGIPAAALTELDGVPVAFTGDWAGSVDMWAVRTGERLPRLDEPTSTVNAVVTWNLDGRPIAVTGSEGVCRMWDLRERHRLDPPLKACEVWALAVTELGGRTLLAAGGYAMPYGKVHLFDLRTREPVGPPVHFPEPVRALAWTPQGTLAVGFGPEVAVVRPPLP